MSCRHHRSPSDEFEGAQGSATNFSAAPWSQYNLRPESNLFYPYAPSNRVRDARAISLTQSAGDTMQVSADGFLLAYMGTTSTLPEPATFSGVFPPTTSPLDPAVDSALLPDTHAGSEDTVACIECGRSFAGLYRSGNLTRHHKHKHSGTAITYNCTVLGCSGVFHRSDARLKHTRIKHPQLCLESGQEGREFQQKQQLPNVNADVPVTQELDYNVGQWMHMNHAWNENSRVRHGCSNSAKSKYSASAAHHVLAGLVGRLRPSECPSVCRSFLTRWHGIVQRLFDDSSSAHAVYARVLDELGAVIRANDVAYSRLTKNGGRSSRAPHGKRAEPCGNKSELGLDSVTSRPDRIFKRSERKKLFASDADKIHRLALGDPSKDAARRQVDCPVYKHHVMNETTPPCQGCRVNVMSQVRSHLNPDRAARTHRGYPQFVEQCSRCKQDFVDRSIYTAHSSAKTCLFQHQARGDIVLPWAKQYFALYPTASRIPVPWADSREWLPDSVLAQCRTAQANLTTRNAVSEERRVPPAAASSSTADERRHSTAMNHMLHDLVSPTYLQSNTSSTPVLNLDRLPFANLFSPVGINAAKYWQEILQNFETLQRNMRKGASHLSSEQLQFMADESARMLDISRNIIRQHQSRAAQSRTHPSADSEIQSTRVHDRGGRSRAQAWQTPPINPQNCWTPGGQLSNHLATPSIETLPSNRSYGAKSSQQAYSTPTNQSSGPITTNATLLGPDSLNESRPTSLPPGLMLEVPPLRSSLPSSLSLPIDGCIDPALLKSPSDNNDADYYSFTPGCFD
ncbi:hypothetical protein BDU57DRAFT_78099 [Ampelomyces quisqualis]|uniref:C2H2-type domain-containing protein n=1 Tax=Ampelomyces quisqualis TaxID=50730 RepID=A0A6A5Q9M7_AMPQU|nr:hypothetical protein BDU57DRAFT_78099 [Ampelomyces quisqualis]